jgi:amidase
MPRGPVAPSLEELRALAAGHGIALAEGEAETYRNAMLGTLRAFRRLDELAEQRLPVRYPRTPGHRPPPEENPFNAWAWRTEIAGAPAGPLAGCRVGIKDMISVAGVPMMNGSPVMAGYVPDIDATVVTRLLDAGAVIAGKTACSDHCFSSGGHTAVYGPVRNPRRPTHSPGGSSKGSAAAIAAGDVAMALGGDQGGSVRIPASWTGVVGLKPTYGLVPYSGCLPIEATLDHIGPMADRVENAARLLSAIAGPDPFDPRQRGDAPPPIDYTTALGQGVAGLRVALLREGFGQTAETRAETGLPPSDPVVDRKVRAAARELEKRGAVVTEVSVPMHVIGHHIWLAVFVEGATELMLRGNGVGSNRLGYYDTHFLDFYGRAWRAAAGDLAHGVKITLLLGEYLARRYHGRYYAKAQNLRHLVREAYDAVLASYDVIVMPTTVIRARPIPDQDAPLDEWLYATLCMTHNCPQADLTGHPAMSIPCGQQDDLPVGLMLVGRHFDEATLLRAADAFERIADWRTM